MPIDEAKFWKLIEEARAEGGEWASASPERMKEVLCRLSDDELLEFGHAFYERLCDLNDWRIWAAGHMITKYMYDDPFHYFRSWIVGRGQEAFETAMRDPDSLGSYVGDPEEIDNELLEYAALDVLEQRGIAEDPRDRSTRNADADPSGEKCPKAELHAKYPKLAKLFG